MSAARHISEIVTETLTAMNTARRDRIAVIWLGSNELAVTDANGVAYAKFVGQYTRADAGQVRQGLLAGGIKRVTGKVEKGVL